MIARIARGGLAAFTIILFVALTRGARAGDLAIPPGYFSSSGGFYTQGCGQRSCLRYAAAGGCTISTDFAAARPIFADGRTGSATYSWYAAEVPTYSSGPAARCPACQPDAVLAPSGERWEEVGPGLPVTEPESSF